MDSVSFLFSTKPTQPEWMLSSFYFYRYRNRCFVRGAVNVIQVEADWCSASGLKLWCHTLAAPLHVCMFPSCISS